MNLHPSPNATARNSRLGGLREELRERRQTRVAHRDLKRELAAYRTPSEVGDLLAAVDRHGNTPQAQQVRAILRQNLWDSARTQRLAS